MAENKTKPTKVSVKEFIDSITDDGKRADARALVRLIESVTGEKPKMWGPSIVGFGIYHYKNPSGREGGYAVGLLLTPEICHRSLRHDWVQRVCGIAGQAGESHHCGRLPSY